MDNTTLTDQRAVDPAEAPALRPHPSRLFVEVTTRCNLRCQMCSKHSPGSGIVEGDLSDEAFVRLAPAFTHLEALILNGIGEPLLHPRLERFIEASKRDMPPAGWVGFQTNGQLLDRQRAFSLVSAGVDRICLSSDAVSPEIFRAMRAGGQREAVVSAVDALHGAMRQCGRQVSVGIEFVAARDNVQELTDLVRWAARNRVNFVIVTQMLPYHEKMTGSVAFDTNTDLAHQHYRKWKASAEADGVDIKRYFDVFMKFVRTPEEERIIDYVKQMVADAWSQGIPFSLERLLKFDEELLLNVGNYFREAEEIARDAGIDLTLPSLVPTRTRCCDFVEGGGAFVSWDGNVHPCYFLWHRYRCYLGGVVKHVRPESFGNILEKGILDIWNGDAFSSFRRGVLKYDFPFCYDCNVALCDYVEMEDFTQDCYVSAVPCAACLWCTGLFRCLQ